MISKITKGSSFKGLLNYLFSKPGAELIGKNVVGETALEIANELEQSSHLSSKVQKPVGHFSLSVPSTDQLNKVDWLSIASDYMNEMGYDCNQYAVVRHTDRDHDHIHIAACRVRLDTGKCTDHDWDYRKSEAVVKKLEQDYNLTPSPSSQDKERRSPTTGERRLLARTGEDSVRVKLQDTIDDLTAEHPTMPELIDLLKDQGINVQVKETVSGSMGISYKLDGVAFSGTNLGRAYTFNGLQKHRDVEYDPERDNDAIAAASSRPPVRTSQNSSTTGSTDSDDDNNETIGAIAPSNTKKVELPGQLPSVPELELEAGNGDEAANSDDDKAATVSNDEALYDDDEKLNYQNISAVSDDFEKESIQNRVNERIEQVREKQAAEQARVSAETAESRRADEQRNNNIYSLNRDNPIFKELIPDEVKALFEESIAQENMGATAPHELQLNDAIAPQNGSNLNSQTDQTISTDPTDQTEPNLNDDDESVDLSINPVEENWLPLRSRLIEEYCLPAEILDVLHEDGWLYANDEGMAVFSVCTFQDIETGLCIFNLETGLSEWLDLNLDPEVEQEVNGEPAFFWIPPQDTKVVNNVILTSDPIETISSVALDPSYGENNTMYIGTESLDRLPIEFLNNPEKLDVVVSFKGDEEGKKLANEVINVLPNSKKEELDEAGWNGELQERLQQAEAEQMQLVPQYQSQQQSQMEL
ncbi:Relaxase/mobilization nuclease family protein (plasmid) [Crinalium epipsammum PCC 9333]|uniref:Relaxase/mobilization nuclease family protein n=1 Tax=Crinalium epipsammum PCC 9333 TaxID=1173022 RepID=K9W7Q7_9CYAN|nr:relaxase/mobilization nuclease domain-containing protein [Crinalium epipsammum]AFZ15495.1 Relaxase/mobilization nuclease family protein [Crinalium epipsammum PCC 9333]